MQQQLHLFYFNLEPHLKLPLFLPLFLPPFSFPSSLSPPFFPPFIFRSPATCGLQSVVMKERLETPLTRTGGFTWTWAELRLRPSAPEMFKSKLELHCPPAFTAEKGKILWNIPGREEAPRLMPWMRNKRNTNIPVTTYLEEHKTALILATQSRLCYQVHPKSG